MRHIGEWELASTTFRLMFGWTDSVHVCCAMLVRGEDTYGHYRPGRTSPVAERDAAALSVHQRVSDRYRENYKIQVTRHEQLYAGDVITWMSREPARNRYSLVSAATGLRRDQSAPDRRHSVQRVEFPRGKADFPLLLARHDDFNLLE